MANDLTVRTAPPVLTWSLQPPEPAAYPTGYPVPSWLVQAPEVVEGGAP